MDEYVKINAPYKRGDDHKLLMGDWCDPALAVLAGIPWVWTEKVDGTNIRLSITSMGLAIGGRTDAAQIPSGLLEAITAMGLEGKMREAFPAADVVLYGEGYGAGIQKGGVYRPDKSFVLFDVKVGPWWLKYDSVREVADRLELDVVPHVLTGTVAAAEAVVRSPGLKSHWGDFTPEGLVGTPVGGFLFRNGRPIKLKVKVKDYR